MVRVQRNHDNAESKLEERKYKHVYYHSSKKVWQAVRGDQKGKSFKSVYHATSQDECAQLAAQAWGIPLRELQLGKGKRERRGPTPQVRPSHKYKYIVWHSTQKHWQVQTSGKSGRFVGTSPTLEGAVSLAMKHLKIPREKLLRKAPSYTGASRSDVCARLALFCRVYSGKRKKEQMLPLDLEDLIAKKKPKSLSEAHGAAIPYLVCKFPSQREQVEKHLPAGKPPQDRDEAVKRLYDSLTLTAHSISKLAYPSEEMRNIGKGMMHHMSFTMLLSRSVKLLVKTDPQQKGALCLGKEDVPYKVSKLTQPLRDSLETWIRFDEALLQSKAPRTCAEWLQETQRLQGVMRGAKRVELPVCGLQDAKAYRGLWVVRAYLIYLMRANGIDRLTIEEGVTVKMFTEMFPDQRKEMISMCGGPSKLNRLIADVMAEAEYPGNQQNI